MALNSSNKHTQKTEIETCIVQDGKIIFFHSCEAEINIQTNSSPDLHTPAIKNYELSIFITLKTVPVKRVQRLMSTSLSCTLV